MFDNKYIRKYKEENNFGVLSNPRSDDKVAIIFETRNLPYLNWVVNTIKYHLKWRVQFYCSYESKNCVDNVDKIIIPNNIEYSDLLKDINFWKNIEEEHILIFQHDSFVIRSGIEEFIEYDYIGSPWFWSYGNYKDKRYKDLTDFQKGGNGGFSLRKKSAMIKIINSNPPNYDYEDMFFSNGLNYGDYNIPDLETKKKFAVESIFYGNPLGIHQITKYLTNEEIKKILFK